MNNLNYEEFSDEIKEAIKYLHHNEFIVLGANYEENNRGSSKAVIYLTDENADIKRCTVETGESTTRLEKCPDDYVMDIDYESITENTMYGEPLYSLEENLNYNDIKEELENVDYIPKDLLRVVMVDKDNSFEIIDSMDKDNGILYINEYREYDEGYNAEWRNMFFYNDSLVKNEPEIDMSL